MRDDLPAERDALADGGQLLQVYVEMAGLLAGAPDVVEFLQSVVELSSQVVPEPVAVGVTLRQGRDVATVAVTGPFASRADEVQYAERQGPCLQAITEREMVHVTDLAAETRWPRYRALALQEGVKSSLSLPLVVDGEGVGALNMYGLHPHRFTEEEIARSRSFARQVSALLTVVLRQVKREQVSDQLQRALVSRATIDQALGIVMGQQQCTASQAFDVLRQASQHRNRKMVDIASDLIRATTGHAPEPPRPFSERS